MCMGVDDIGGLSMARSRSRESANPATGLLVFPMLIPATSVGNDFKRTSKSWRRTVADTKSRAHRRHGKGRRYCKDAPSAADAEGTSVFDMPRDGEGRKPGMS